MYRWRFGAFADSLETLAYCGRFLLARRGNTHLPSELVRASSTHTRLSHGWMDRPPNP